MTTTDFEEWLEREDFPIKETLDVEDFQRYLAEEYGFKGAQLDVARGVWEERYNILDKYYPELGIRATLRHYLVQGIEHVETRYGITGEPGLWGRERMFEFAISRAEERLLYEAAAWLRAKREEEYGR
uniref:Uncharacterized protein n=1 Tax=viral metagenome TaxID=1070528 RepID=A0A6H2A488_9ZZZZ